jgi:hypothetical protein
MANYYSTSRTNYCKFNIETLKAFIARIEDDCSFCVWLKYNKETLTEEVIAAAVEAHRATLTKEDSEKLSDYKIKNELFPETMTTSIGLSESAAQHLESLAFGFDDGTPYVEIENEEGENEEMDFLYELSICMEEEQVLVYQESGSEKMRYVTGVSIAHNYKGESVCIDINDIYKRAAKEFGVNEHKISLAQY